jgi:hypothetical protein
MDFVNVPALGEVAKFGTDYFLLKIKFLAKYKRVFTTKFAILPNACCVSAFIVPRLLIVLLIYLAKSIPNSREDGFFHFQVFRVLIVKFLSLILLCHLFGGNAFLYFTHCQLNQLGVHI